MSFFLSMSTLMSPSLPPWLEALCQRLAENDPSLTSLELTHPRIDDVQARAVAQAFQNSHASSVDTVLLSCHAMVDDGCAVLARQLASVTLQTLQLRDLRNHREFAAFFQPLQSGRGLRELSLRHCRLCPRSAETVAAFLASPAGSLVVEFRLVDCELLSPTIRNKTENDDDKDSQDSLRILVTQGLRVCPSLERLYIVHSILTTPVEEHYGDMINNVWMTLLTPSRTSVDNEVSGCRLRELHLCENNLGDVGIVALCRALRQETTLRHLNIRSNGITSQGCLALQGLLLASSHHASTKFTMLESLGLSHNEIDSLGVAALARGVASSQSLKSLDLSSNQISSTGALALAKWVLRGSGRHANGNINKRKPACCLNKLNLARNHVGDEGVAHLAAALLDNSFTNLVWLSLQKNDITNVGATNLAAALPKIFCLKELLLNRNEDIGPIGAKALLNGLRCNTELEHLYVEDAIANSATGKKMFYWIRLNKAGRRILRHSQVSVTLWPTLYSRIACDTEAIFHFVNEKPDLFALISDYSLNRNPSEENGRKVAKSMLGVMHK